MPDERLFGQVTSGMVFKQFDPAFRLPPAMPLALGPASDNWRVTVTGCLTLSPFRVTEDDVTEAANRAHEVRQRWVQALGDEWIGEAFGADGSVIARAAGKPDDVAVELAIATMPPEDN
jgi:hypothetical protein